MNDLFLSAARVLLAKNFPFCIYRFPGEHAFRLAVEEALLPDDPFCDFWVSPFDGASAAENIYLKVLRRESMSADLLATYKSLPLRPWAGIALPASTGKPAYMQRVHDYLEGIHRGKIKKAILSRIENIQKPGYFDAIKVFEALSEKFPGTCVHLLYHPHAGTWMGATPELLLSAADTQVATMALAGTQPANDLRHYTWQEKEKEEQHMVEQHVASVFAKYPFALQAKTGPLTTEAGPVAHLRTEYRFLKNGNTNLVSLLKDLHPTPAVGGLPAKEAVDFILQHEGYDRNFYCGFLGETDFENYAQLYINLRCMQIGENEIAIYCGGGITAGSDPESEWEETVHKSMAMLETLNECNEAVR